MQSLLFLNLGTPEIIILLITGLVPLAFVVVCLIDIVRSDFKDSTTKLLWVLIVILAPVLGSLIYLLIGKNQKVPNLAK
ncbi:MAG: PLDc protein [Sphingobacteriaceae bacterium]|nr:PLDc protein [Sphingobacteriaceae bacterium]